MMLEADIVLGTHGEDADIIPIMGHPPTDKSDLSLQEFLQAIQDFNSNANNTAKKGIKLDFKTIEVFQASLTIIKDLYPQVKYLNLEKNYINLITLVGNDLIYVCVYL